MLPPSWKSEVEKSIEEEANRSAAKRESSNAEQSAAIARQLTALIDQLKGEEDREKRPKQIKIWTDAITLFLVAATAVFTGLAWLVFKEQLGEMQRAYGPISEQAVAATSAAKTASDALTKAQRPFVYQKSIWYRPFTKDGKKAWRGLIEWENSGLTPTKTATFELVCPTLPFPLGTGLIDPYALKRLMAEQKKIGRIFQILAPKQSKFGGQCEFLSDEMAKVKNGIATTYIIGQVTYDDIFNISHITRHCEYIYQIEGDPAAFTSIEVSGISCARHNCD